jgi:hypothetical protein
MHSNSVTRANLQESQLAGAVRGVPSEALDGLVRKINSIDLSMVKLKLMDQEEGQGWSREYVDLVEVRYRKYLLMLRADPGSDAVPTRDIDLFWHQHILDTRAYARDCERVFGEFIHHFPYFGMRGEEDALDLRDSFEETKALYMRLFGELYCEDENPAAPGRCHKGCTKCHKCSSGCGMKCTKCKSGSQR